MNANFVSNESSNDICWLNVLCVHSKINIHFYFVYVLFEVQYLEKSIIDIKFKNWTKLFKNNTLTLSLSNMVWNQEVFKVLEKHKIHCLALHWWHKWKQKARNFWFIWLKLGWWWWHLKINLWKSLYGGVMMWSNMNQTIVAPWCI